MGKKSNKKKNDQLGMNHATAANRLRKMVLFELIVMQELDRCYRCGEAIEAVHDLSIEHKEPWLDSDDPVGLYFDLRNIAFSHLSCNVRAGRRAKGPLEAKHGGRAMYVRHKCRCDICREGNRKYIQQWRKNKDGEN